MPRSWRVDQLGQGGTGAVLVEGSLFVGGNDVEIAARTDDSPPFF